MTQLTCNTILINEFFKATSTKKKFMSVLDKKSVNLSELKKQNYKNLIFESVIKFNKIQLNLVSYIVEVCFSKSNMFLHVMSSSGKLKIFFSATSLLYYNKKNKSKKNILNFIFSIFIKKLSFFKNKKLALHFKNIRFMKFRVIKKLKKKFFLKTVRFFNVYSHNGCRKKKVRRKKFKKRLLLNEKMAEWFKAADCKSV